MKNWKRGVATQSRQEAEATPQPATMHKMTMVANPMRATTSLFGTSSMNIAPQSSSASKIWFMMASSGLHVGVRQGLLSHLQDVLGNY
eukprot:6012853-Amphidinium_carterae.1